MADASSKMPACPDAAKRKQPRGRDAAATRADIARAAAFRFAHRGYAGVTLQDIADDVGVTAALVNRYFGSKRALFDLVVSTLGQLEVTGDPGQLADEVKDFWDDEQVYAPALALLRSIDLDGGLRFRTEFQHRVRQPVLEAIGPDEEAIAKTRLVESLLLGVGLFGLGVMTGDNQLSADEKQAMHRRLTRMLAACLSD
ncbi:helix-turn-helix domain-containing protein [Streptomyces umbrinus]|uniref:helix-turn-helix domain-containing protein n=1 Tax=Streptomyces umbrinus TaxID=67370 RepID=UPI0033CED417